MQPKVPDAPVSFKSAITKGTSSAPVVLIVFSDFQCPFCRQFAKEVLPVIEHDYLSTGRVLLVYRHLPLKIHEHAERAAEAAECAAAQGRFWAMHDGIFDNGHLDDETLRRLAISTGVDGPIFDACIDSVERTNAVKRDLAQARQLGLNSTPAFLLGTRVNNDEVKVSKVFFGVSSLTNFRRELDVALSQKSLLGRLWPATN